MIKIYGKENCSRCEEVKNYCINTEMEYEYIEDVKQLRIAASKARIMMAPVIEKEGKYMSMNDFYNEVG